MELVIRYNPEEINSKEFELYQEALYLVTYLKQHGFNIDLDYTAKSFPKMLHPVLEAASSLLDKRKIQKNYEKKITLEEKIEQLQKLISSAQAIQEIREKYKARCLNTAKNNSVEDIAA
jgi:hypothetical protein